MPNKHNENSTNRTSGSAKRHPQYTHDDLGRPIVQIMLPDGTHAVADLDKFRVLRENETTDQWFFNQNSHGRGYVRCRYKGGNAMVSRLITNAPVGSFVCHRNGNQRDLRMSNLRVTLKKGKVNA